MSTTQSSRIDNTELVTKGIELAALDPVSAKALWDTLESEEKHKLFMRHSQVRDIVSADPEWKKQRLDQKEKKEKKANINTIKSMTLAKRAVELHNDPKYNNLYSHQQKFQDTLIANYANNSEAVKVMQEVSSQIDTIKLDMMSLKNEEKNLPVNRRSVVHGGDTKQSTNGSVGADGISYGRNESYDGLPEADNNKIDDIITKLEAVDVSESDAIRLIVLRLGLGKYGLQDPDGEFYRVGHYGTFAYSRTNIGNVQYFYLDGSDIWRCSGGQENARAFLRS